MQAWLDGHQFLTPLTKAQTKIKNLSTNCFLYKYIQIYSFQIKKFIVEIILFTHMAIRGNNKRYNMRFSTYYKVCMLFFTEHMINFWCNAREHPGMYYYIVSFSAIKVTVNDCLSFP